MNLPVASVALADGNPLPPVTGFYQYVVSANGLHIRAEDARLSACVCVASRSLNALEPLDEAFVLKLPRVPGGFLRAVANSARRHLPNEAMYQFTFDGEWTCRMPASAATPTALAFADFPNAVIDLHSHGTMDAFFSETDNADEQGFRLYVVIGNVDTDRPTIECRAGVYGHYMWLDARAIFEYAFETEALTTQAFRI